MTVYLTMIANGLRYASRFRLLVPLYLGTLLVSLIQIWPLFGNNALYNPLIGALADRTTDVFVDLISNAPDAAASTSAAWSGLTLVLSLIVGGLYNFFSGGMLSVWAGKRSFWAGSRHFFISFAGLGMVLYFFLLIAIAIGSGIGVAFGVPAGTISTIILLQFVNLFGEYARAAAITQNRRNPLLLYGSAIRLVIQNLPITLLLAIVGLLLHSGIALLYATLATQVSGFPNTIFLEQGVVLAWLWIKLLRLAWALSVTQARSSKTESRTHVLPEITIS